MAEEAEKKVEFAPEAIVAIRNAIVTELMDYFSVSQDGLELREPEAQMIAGRMISRLQARQSHDS